MNRHLDKLLLISIILLAAGLVWVVSGTLDVPVTNAGDIAPEFSVTTADGKTITRDNFGGKLLVLNFWASWCAPCVEETPSLEEFARELGPEGVVVLGISNDGNEKLYRRFVQQFGITFETAWDPESNISASYGTFLQPETYLIDRNGKVLEKIISSPPMGWMDPDLIARVRKML